MHDEPLRVAPCLKLGYFSVVLVHLEHADPFLRQRDTFATKKNIDFL